jgi:uncharacterized protein (TIGR02466 family)
MSENITIDGLFPTPLMRTNLGKNLSKKEIKFINECEKNLIVNVGNKTSSNNYVLNDKNFFSLKNKFDKYIQIYFNEIIRPKNKIKPYITQSWINYTKEDQYHHAHAHPNSLISGVFYIDVNNKTDRIKFFRKNEDTIKIYSEDYNIFNSESWWIPVKNGDLILFPSHLQHSVELKKTKGVRKSLSFNVFVKGVLGKSEQLNELKL